jgi:hypothetical protein
MENIYMNGNERTVAMFGTKESSVKSGYHMNPADTLMLNTELMNLDDVEKWVWPTFTYEYVEGYHPEYKEGKVLWQSIGANSCGNATNPFGASNTTLAGQPLKTAFSEHSVPWTATRDAEILGSAAHMHPGGISTEVFRNQDVLCKSEPVYSRDSRSMSGSASHSHKKRQLMASKDASVELMYIKNQDACIFKTPQKLKKGDKLYISANYNFTQHPGLVLH